MPRPTKKITGLHTTSSEFMPDDLLITILERLQVKPLLRFKCVSKSWCNLITSPVFVNAHLQKQHQKNDSVLLVSRCLRDSPRRKRVFSFHDLDSPELEQLGPNRVIPVREARDFVLGPCNGIICLASNYSVILWNPALRKLKFLPCCPFASKADILPDNYGEHRNVSMTWGFCNTTNGFIVVQLQCTNISSWFDRAKKESLIEACLYDSETSMWRKIKDTYKVSNELTISESSDIFLNGACHWQVRDENHDFIITLDVNNEVFGLLDCPDWATESGPGSWIPKVINNRLALVWRKPLLSEDSEHIDNNAWVVEEEDYGVTTEYIEVWVMKEYGVKKSWTLQFISGIHELAIPLLFSKNNMWMLMTDKEGLQQQLVSRNLSTNEMKRYGISGCVNESFRAQIYSESLIPME